MTLLEYIKSMDTTGEAVYSDEWTKENGVYVNINVLRSLDGTNDFLCALLYDCFGYDLWAAGNADNIQYIDGPDFEYLNETELVIDEEVSNYKAWVKYPYYQLRGKRVTEEQALDIIRRTDGIFQSYRIETADAIDLTHFYNNWFGSEWCHGWCHPSGIIGLNANTSRWPELDELIGTMIKLKYAFPYLDFVAAVTCWDELPPWSELLPDAWGRKKQPPDFLKGIEIGIWLHDKAIEFMGPERARQVYQAYEAKYAEADSGIYEPEYYQDHEIFTADTAYLKRCLAANGLDPDRALSRVREYIWKK